LAKLFLFSISQNESMNMKDLSIKLNRAINISLFISVIFLAAFVLSGYDKEKMNLSEMQSRLSEQQAQIEELQRFKDEQGQKIEKQQATIDELQNTRETQANEVKPTDARSIADEVYCQTNAEKYTKNNYEVYEERPDHTRDHCSDKYSNYDCDEAVSKAKKLFEEFKIEYNSYHNKCG